MKHAFLLSFINLFFFFQGSCQEITVFPGFWGPKYYMDSNRIKSSDVAILMKENKFSNKYWHKSKVQNSLSYVALAGQLAFTFYLLDNPYDRKKATTSLVGNLICGGLAIGFSFASQNSKRKAILYYNENLKKKGQSSMYIGAGSDGIGAVVKF